MVTQGAPRTTPSLGLIGPTLPFRGGIAQHTTMLHRALTARATVHSLSFKRQYPQWMYPGKSDQEPGWEGHREPGVSYILDSMNPVTWMRACSLLGEKSVRAVIVPWWNVFWAPCYLFIACRLRRRGIKVLFLCHNVSDHEGGVWKTALSRTVLSRGDFFLTHTGAVAEELRAWLPGVAVAVHPHPSYTHFPEPRGVLARRAALELLFFGFVRPYKGLDVLIEAMRLLGGEDVFLTVAGEWWKTGAELREQVEAKEVRRRIEVIDRYVTEEETAELFSRADVVVLPYRGASGTGVIPLAYHYRKPVIATVVGGLPEVVEDGVTGRLVRPADPHALSEAIRGFLNAPRGGMRKGIEEVAKQMTWERLADTIVGLVTTRG